MVPGRFVHRLAREANLYRAYLCEPIAVVLRLGRLERTWGDDERMECAVVGGGPIGHLCARILALRGHDVTVFDRDPLRRSYFDTAGISTAEGLDEVAKYEILIEATGDPQALDDILHLSAPGSCLLLLGLPYARREFNFESVVAYDKTIVGSVGSSAREFEEAIDMLPRLNLSLFLDWGFSLDEFQDAWKASRSRCHLKVFLEVDGSSI